MDNQNQGINAQYSPNSSKPVTNLNSGIDYNYINHNQVLQNPNLKKNFMMHDPMGFFLPKDKMGINPQFSGMSIMLLIRCEFQRSEKYLLF